jgi:hypothetical protein
MTLVGGIHGHNRLGKVGRKAMKRFGTTSEGFLIASSPEIRVVESKVLLWAGDFMKKS